MTKRDLYFLLLVALSLGLFWTPLRTLVTLALHDDAYSHILVIPAISAGFLYWIDRKKIFENARPWLGGAATLLGVAAGLYWFAQRHSPDSMSGYFSLTIFSVILFWTGGFLLFYGPQAFRAAAFPFFLLVLVVPIPQFVLSRIIYALQIGSSDVSYWLFTLTSVPVLREGFLFFLPGLTIEVAEQCSGIRSSQALVIVCLLLGHLFLRTSSRKVSLVLAAIPILIFKNALRIVTICLLSIYVDRGFLTGRLHVSGGILFFVLGFLALIPIIHLLAKSENQPTRAIAGT